MSKQAMAKAVQQRTLKTRAKLLDAAQAVVSESGYEAMRVEEVVLRAGTAKGTFFAHFKDKDALMELIIGARLDTYLAELEAAPDPHAVEALAQSPVPYTPTALPNRRNR